MLVLSRKLGEAIHIAEAVEVRVLEIRKGRIKLGISCPPDVPIRREDVYRRPINCLADGRTRTPCLDRNGCPVATRSVDSNDNPRAHGMLGRSF